VSSTNNKVFAKSFLRIIENLSPKRKVESFFIVVLIFLLSIIDLFGLAAVIPIIYMATDYNVVYSNSILHSIFEISGIKDPRTFIFVSVLALFGVFLMKNLAGIFIQYIYSRFSFSIASELTNTQMNRYYRKPYIYFKNNNSNIIARDIATIPTEFASNILIPGFTILTEVVIILLMSVGIAIYNFSLWLTVILVMGPAIFLFYSVARKRIYMLGQNRNFLRGKLYKELYENLHGFVDVKLSNKESFFIERFKVSLESFFTNQRQYFVIESSTTKFIEIVAFGGIVLIFVYGLYFSKGNEQILSFLTIFATASYRLMPSANRMLNAFMKIRSSEYILDTLERDASEDIKHATKTDVDIEIPFSDAISIDNVNFHYNESSPVLKGISFHIRKGEMIGVIGETGSGKTTLINIILRLFIEKSGSILIDGKPLTPSHTISYHKKIAYVRQDFYLIDGSLAENIAFGIKKEDWDESRIMDVLDKTYLSEFVKKLPNGIHTSIGEHGGKLSGGQKQRVAIARALYNNCEIIVFDEATSALDNDTEEEILQTIKTLQDAHKTVILIAHRLTTLRYCNRIYEIANGEILKVHNYQDLIKEKLGLE
jgi:ABC-type multidrug transport system fused ATPase/permease subunit